MKCKLYLLKMGFSDKNYNGDIFFCPDCTMLEGILAKNPTLYENIDVEYIEFEKPRKELISILGEENQSLPVLVLPNGTQSTYQDGVYNNISFISDLNNIMSFLSDTYHVAKKHP